MKTPFLQLSALAPEIFKSEKWVKYANEMTDDLIHSTQYYIEYINRVCEILLIEAKKVLLNAILTKEMKNSNLFPLSTHYCKNFNFEISFVYDLVS